MSTGTDLPLLPLQKTQNEHTTFYPVGWPLQTSHPSLSFQPQPQITAKKRTARIT